MPTKILSKPETQKMIKALRNAGLTVKKIVGGYRCVNKCEKQIFRAMEGSRGYLVNYVDGLFESDGS